MELTEAIIAAHPFWSGFRIEHLPILRKCGSLVEMPAGQEMFHEGEPAEAFYLVRRGKVALQVHGPGQEIITIQTVKEGEPIGFSWLFNPHVWHFGARTLESSEFIRFEAKPLRDFMNANVEFGRALALQVGQVVLERLLATQATLARCRVPAP